MVRALLTVLLTALATTLAFGCSDEPAPDTPTQAETTAEPPEFATAADTFCSEAMAEQEALRREKGGRQITLGDRARLLVELAPPRIALAQDLAALEPPPGDAKQAEQLVAAAERRGEASARAGELWQEDGPKDEIAEQAAIEHDERERFVEIARGLGLGACAEILSSEEREAAEAGALSLFSRDPSERCDSLGRRLEDELFADGQTCREDEILLAIPVGGTVTGAEGMDRVFALVRVETPEGEYRVRLTYEDGAYKVDKID
jgi:hypothetical protein